MVTLHGFCPLPFSLLILFLPEVAEIAKPEEVPILHQPKVAWHKLIAEVADLWSWEAEAFQRAEGAEKELMAWCQDGAEAMQIKRERDQLR